MIRAVSLACIAALLGVGCSSAAKEDAVMLRGKPPLLSIESDKDVETYIGCLNPKLVAIHHPVQLMRDGDATVLRLTSLANPVLVIEVRPKPSGGSSISGRARFANGKGVAKSIDAAKECG